MTDQVPPTVIAPPASLGNALATMFLRHALSGLGTTFAAWGLLDKNEVDTFVKLGVGLALFFGSTLWGVFKEVATRNHWFEAFYSHPAVTVITASAIQKDTANGA